MGEKEEKVQERRGKNLEKEGKILRKRENWEQKAKIR